VVVPGLSNRATAMFMQHGPHAVILGPMSSVYRRAIGE
jgi:hypothetical protein